MGASAIWKRHDTLTYLMLHRNINAGSRQAISQLTMSTRAERPRLLTVLAVSAMLLKLHRKIAAGDSGPAARGRIS
jgi:hypothetical protein